MLAAPLRIGLIVLSLVIAIAGALVVRPFGYGGAGVGPEAVAEAAARTSNSGGFKFALSAQLELPDRDPVSFTGSGLSDPRGQRGIARMDMSPFAELAGAPAAATGDWNMEVLFDRRFLYMKWALLSQALGGSSWMKLDLERMSKALGVDPALIRAQQQQGGDPASALRYLRSATDDIEELGTEEIRGVETTHLRASIDLSGYPEQFRDAVGNRLEMDIWVDDGELVRRVSWTQSITAPGSDQAVEASFTCDYFDFGTEVVVEPPPDADVTDMTDAVARASAR